MPGISVVINTLNEEKNIARAIESVKWAQEIIVCDMYSTDDTAKIAKGLGARVINCKKIDYVEPARNFAISKTTEDWILILDADEEIPTELAKRLQEIIRNETKVNFVEIPRRNIIFGKGLTATGWWPDNHIRFFKKGTVIWKNEIHSKPETRGVGLTLDSEEKWAIIHHNYQTIAQFIERMNRYTTVEAKELKKSGYNFRWQDLFEKPLNEFLSRYFANKGYVDGLHGLALSLFQAFSFLVLYLKIWDIEGFKEQNIGREEFYLESKKAGDSLKYWANQKNKLKGLFKIFKR